VAASALRRIIGTQFSILIWHLQVATMFRMLNVARVDACANSRSSSRNDRAASGSPRFAASRLRPSPSERGQTTPNTTFDAAACRSRLFRGRLNRGTIRAIFDSKDAVDRGAIRRWKVAKESVESARGSRRSGQQVRTASKSCRKRRHVMKALLNNFKNFIRDEEGATATEYAVMLALIIVIALGAISALGTKVSDTFADIEAAMP
jgi:pilus assembly protein Flp/PilA